MGKFNKNKSTICVSYQPERGLWDFRQQRRNTATQQRQTCVHSVQLSAGIQEILPQMQRPLVAVRLQQYNIILNKTCDILSVSV